MVKEVQVPETSVAVERKVYKQFVTFPQDKAALAKEASKQVRDTSAQTATES